MNIYKNSDIGYILEVILSYLENLYDFYLDLLLVLEFIIVYVDDLFLYCWEEF